MEIKDKDTLRFIDRLYKDLYKSGDVLHYSRGNATDKFGNLKRYFDALEHTHEKVSKTGRHIDMLKQFYYDRYVIKKDNISKSVFELEERVALEEGHGHVKYSEDTKQMKIKTIIKDQKKSLDRWIDYFLSGESSVYPFWLKYWAFQGMLKIGKYDKKTGKYTPRTKETASVFVDLNKEALSLAMDLVIKTLKKERIDDNELENLVRSGSFPKIYTYIISNVLSNNRDIVKRNQGKWVKYNRGSNYMKLVNSIQGYNTGWCIAGEETAKKFLSMGDIYIYYTLDNNDEYKVPRAAIRMEGPSIAEIRGIETGQSIETEMEQVIEEKIKNFPDKDEYLKKFQDMKLLTKIGKKIENNEDLTFEELTFLYEINYKIKGFGDEPDPRIVEFIELRDVVKDLNLIFSKIKKIDDKFTMISLNQTEESRIFNQERKFERPAASMFANIEYEDIENLSFSQVTINGDLDLSVIGTAKKMNFSGSVINGNLDLSNLTKAETLDFSNASINFENLDLSNLTNVEILDFSNAKIKGYLFLSNLKTYSNLLLSGLDVWILDLRSLTIADNLILPNKVRNSVHMENVVSAKGLVLPQVAPGGVYLKNLEDITDLVLPDELTYTIYLAQGVKITKENVDEYRTKKTL